MPLSPLYQLDNSVFRLHCLAMTEQHLDTFFHFFSRESFSADCVDNLVDTGASPFSTDIADGILDYPYNIPLLLGDSRDNLVDIKCPRPRIIGDLAQTGIDDVDNPLRIADLNIV